MGGPQKPMFVKVIHFIHFFPKVFGALCLVWLAVSGAQGQAINDLSNGHYNEGGSPAIIDADVNITGDNNFTGGFFEITISNPDLTDQLSILGGGSLSSVGNAILWDGKRVGTIDNLKKWFLVATH